MTFPSEWHTHIHLGRILCDVFIVLISLHVIGVACMQAGIHSVIWMKQTFEVEAGVHHDE